MILRIFVVQSLFSAIEQKLCRKKICVFLFQFRFKNYSADAAFTFTDSAITATGESSGYEIDGTHLTIEAAELNVLSGDITILSSDDCMNAANSDLGNYDFVINISGGTQPGARPGGNMGDMQPPSGEPGGQKPNGEPPAKPE